METRGCQVQIDLESLRRHYSSLSDEELLVRMYAGEDGPKVLGKASRPEEYLSARHPVAALIQELATKRHLGHVVVRKGDLTIALHQPAPDAAVRT